LGLRLNDGKRLPAVPIKLTVWQRDNSSSPLPAGGFPKKLKIPVTTAWICFMGW
jgi:hypothetical protein